MTKKEIKQKSIEKINNAVSIIQCKKEKVTNKRISEVSGLSEITVKRYRKEIVSDKNEIVSHESKIVSHPNKNVSDEKTIPVSDAFKHFLKRR